MPTAEGRKKISFIEQAKKRAECDRLAAYIMTVDLMLNSVLHQVKIDRKHSELLAHAY